MARTLSGPLTMLWFLAFYAATVWLLKALPHADALASRPGIENIAWASAVFATFLLYMSRLYTGLLRSVAPRAVWVIAYDSLVLPSLVLAIALFGESSIRGPFAFHSWTNEVVIAAVVWGALVIDPLGRMGEGIIRSAHFALMIERAAANGNMWQFGGRIPPRSVGDIVFPFVLINLGFLGAILVLANMGRNAS